MFLFRGDFGCLLFTGDFRWEATSERAKIERTTLLNALQDDVVDILYVDNTYCNPSYEFPSREVAAQQIWVWPERLQTMHLLGFHDIFTTKTSLTRVRAVPRYSFSIDTLRGLNTMRPTIGIMPSGLPWVMKPVKGDDKLFGSLLTSRYNKSKRNENGPMHTDKLNGNLVSVERYHEYAYSVPYSDHSCFLEIQEFIKLVQPTNMKGIVSSSTCYVDPLYYFGRLCGASKLPQRLHHKHERKEGDDRAEAVQTKSYFGSDKSSEIKRKRKTQLKVLNRVSALRWVQRGAKFLEN